MSRLRPLLRSVAQTLLVLVVVTFLTICIIRFIAVGYHISLPTLHGENEKKREKRH